MTIRGGRYLEVARLGLSKEEGGDAGEAAGAGVRLEPLLRQDTFSTLRSICKIRPVGASKVGVYVLGQGQATRIGRILHPPSLHPYHPPYQHTRPQDYVVVGSDSGRLSLLELVRYDEGQWGYYRLRCAAWMPLGPGGCRRAVPGQYVAADPKGRAVFTGK